MAVARTWRDLVATIMDREPSEGESKGWQARMMPRVKAQHGCTWGLTRGPQPPPGWACAAVGTLRRRIGQGRDRKMST